MREPATGLGPHPGADRGKRAFDRGESGGIIADGENLRSGERRRPDLLEGIDDRRSRPRQCQVGDRSRARRFETVVEAVGCVEYEGGRGGQRGDRGGAPSVRSDRGQIQRDRVWRLTAQRTRGFLKLLWGTMSAANFIRSPICAIFATIRMVVSPPLNIAQGALHWPNCAKSGLEFLISVDTVSLIHS